MRRASCWITAWRATLMIAAALGMLGHTTSVQGQATQSVEGSSTASRATWYGMCNATSTTVRPGTFDQTIQSGGLTRRYTVHIPPSYDAKTPLPLVVSLHGFMGSSFDQQLWTGWNAIADREHFIVVYPNGTGFPQRWNAGNSPYLTSWAPLADDVAFFRDLFNALDQTLCIDDSQVFVSGLSNGGGMANRLACEMAERIAAIGTVAGAYSPIPGGCNPVRPIPVIAFHGDADPIVNYYGNPSQQFPPIQQWTADWAKRNGCQKGPDTLPTQGDVSGIAYSDCALNADVNLYTIHGGGHAWPGGLPIPFVGSTSTAINASETMWEFFKAHPFPTQP